MLKNSSVLDRIGGRPGVRDERAKGQGSKRVNHFSGSEKDRVKEPLA
jgi:hypothetical protein